MFCENCGNKIPDGGQFCSRCGAKAEPGPYVNERPPAYKPPSGAYAGGMTGNQSPGYGGPAPGMLPQPKKSMLWLILAISVVAVAGLCIGVYFLFFAGNPGKQPSSALEISEKTEKPAAVDYATTRDVADLVGEWTGELEYTDISGDWETFGYPVSQGYIQPFMLKIREGSPEVNWREVILSIDGGDAAVWEAAFEGSSLEIYGEWQSSDVSISVNYDASRGGFVGTGEYIGQDKHTTFDFFMAPIDESTAQSNAIPGLDEVIGGTWSLYAGVDQSGELIYSSPDWSEFTFSFDADNGFSGVYRYGDGYVDATFTGTYDVTDSMAVEKDPYKWYYYATIDEDSIVDSGETGLLGRLGEYGSHLIFKFREMDGEKLLYEEMQKLYFKKSMTPTDSEDISAPTDATQAAATVSNKTITVSMDYDSGDGVYTGEVNGSGAPHGQGSFAMNTSDTGKSWSYDGQWVNGEITGEGVMTQGDFVFSGSFKSGLLEGYCEITDDGILRYKGMCKSGKLHGQGTLYTSSGMLLFEGEFQNDMLVESAAARQARGAAFKPECEDMDEALYDGCMAEDNTFGYPVAVWGFPLAMAEQASSGTIVIGHMGDDSYPVCLVYRYGVDEPKMPADDWINAWGVVAGLYEYVDGDGLTVTCPLIEVVCWDNSMENYEE